MNSTDIFIGIIIGACSTGMIASAIWLWRDREQGPLVINDDDGPFRPVTDNDLRLVRVCEQCRRYLCESRTITAGQHLNVIYSVCPRCAKRAAVAVKPAVV